MDALDYGLEVLDDDPVIVSCFGRLDDTAMAAIADAVLEAGDGGRSVVLDLHEAQVVSAPARAALAAIDPADR